MIDSLVEVLLDLQHALASSLISVIGWAVKGACAAIYECCVTRPYTYVALQLARVRNSLLSIPDAEVLLLVSVFSVALVVLLQRLLSSSNLRQQWSHRWSQQQWRRWLASSSLWLRNQCSQLRRRLTFTFPAVTTGSEHRPAGVGDDREATCDAHKAAECCVCLSSPATVAIVPCGHKCLCEVCLPRVKLRRKCPKCRGLIRDTLRVFE